MPKILLIPFEDIPEEVLEAVKAEVSATFRSEVIVYKKVKIPEGRERGAQLDAGYFIPAVMEIVAKEKADCGLGITNKDLFVPEMNFVFGLASGNACVISLARLQGDLLLERAVKEAVHELGHVFGLGHCPDARCVMHFSNCLADTDYKGKDFCDKCKKAIKF